MKNPNDKFLNAFQKNQKQQQNIVSRIAHSIICFLVYLIVDIVLKYSALCISRMEKLYFRLVNGSCELERICAKETISSVRIKKIGKQNKVYIKLTIVD